MSTPAPAFNPVMAPLSANLVNALVISNWAPKLSEAISAYTASFASGGRPASDGLVPAAREQSARLLGLINGLNTCGRKARRLTANFTAQRDATLVAEKLAAEGNFFSAAVVFRDVAEAVLSVSNAFQHYGPWREIHRQNHHLAVAGFLLERAAEMFARAGNYKEARGFARAADMYGKLFTVGRPEADLWSKRAMGNLAEVLEETASRYDSEAAWIWRENGNHGRYVSAMRRALHLGPNDPLPLNAHDSSMDPMELEFRRVGFTIDDLPLMPLSAAADGQETGVPAIDKSLLYETIETGPWPLRGDARITPPILPPKAARGTRTAPSRHARPKGPIVRVPEGLDLDLRRLRLQEVRGRNSYEGDHPAYLDTALRRGPRKRGGRQKKT